MDKLLIKLVDSPEDFEGALAVRLRVFVQEQDVPLEEEVDHLDNAAIHAIAKMGDSVIATGRLILEEMPLVYIGRMSVDVDYRRHGVGSKLLEFLEDEAKKCGAATIALHAQEYVKTFYSAHDYEEKGGVFLEANIPHILMHKDISD